MTLIIQGDFCCHGDSKHEVMIVLQSVCSDN